MEASSASSSSRVKVEYSDPSAIYPLVSDQLLSRLPLRNLHWNSISRPLRSINSLYVELVSDQARTTPSRSRPVSSAGQTGPAFRTDSPGVISNEGIELEFSATKRERRHQIPGLRQTPYLKIYLLRCDDVETYKASSRKMLREWIREHTPSSQSTTAINSQENHDAFEWLIVHVVSPDISVSSRPNQSANTKTEAGGEGVTNPSRWPSRATLSLVDKIRADFNGSSKSSVDRVVQVLAARSPQVQDLNDVSLHYGTSPEEYSRDSAQGWAELLVKMKSLILASFDLRVRQYEEDIREKGSQRNLPGWNFCTFFVLKEGLARGFESVGLVEDALMGYDELSVELEVATREQKEKDFQDQHASLFRGHTQELLIQAEQALESMQGTITSSHRSHSGFSLLDSDRKPYRDLILANNISAFDFQCYLFARQLTLLLRLARMSSPPGHPPVASADNPGQGPAVNNGESEDLVVLAEACRRAVVFITSAGSMLREDLEVSFIREPGIDVSSLADRHNVIENLVCSWTFTSCHDIIARTSVASLSARLKPHSHEAALSIEEPRRGSTSQDSYNPVNVTERDKLPPRTSSLMDRAPPAASSSRQEEFSPADPIRNSNLVPSGQLQTGIHALAAQRADLYLAARQALSSIGARCGWKCDLSTLACGVGSDSDGLEDVPLEDESAEPARTSQASRAQEVRRVLSGLSQESLLAAMASIRDFYSLYEDLSKGALEHYQIAGRRKSTAAMTADIAALRFYLKDYSGAASYFHHMAPFYAENGWKTLEISVLDMYARCLKRLGRLEEYIGIALKLLAQLAYQNTQAADIGDRIQRPDSFTLRSTIADTNDYLKDLVSTSKALKEPMPILMDRYFKDIRVEPYVLHFEEKDGFQLALRLRYILQKPLDVQQVKVRLVSVGEAQLRDIWLSASNSLKMQPGPVTVLVTSNVLIPAWYVVDKVLVQSENIVFTHDFSPVSRGALFGGKRTSVVSDAFKDQEPRILVWSPQRALEARLSSFTEIHLEKIRSIVIEVSSGSNIVLHGELLLRAGSAGLRLHTADAEVMNGDILISDKSQPGIIRFSRLPANAFMRIRIPYRLENEATDIIVKVEVAYATPQGDFLYACNPQISVLLPLGVNVQDIFKRNVLFSKFSVSTASSMPLRLSRCHLEQTDDFEVTSPPLGKSCLDVFVRQPVSMMYRISRKERRVAPREELQSRLLMHIEYLCLDEEVCEVVEECLYNFLSDTGMESFSRLLGFFLCKSLRSRMSPQNLEMVGCLREVDVGTFEEFHWEGVLNALPHNARQKVASLLRRWHEQHRVILLRRDCKGAQIRRILIPVDIPPVQVVHTVRLRIDKPSQMQAHSRLAAVGQALSAELKIHHSRKWDARTAPIYNEKELAFCYELDASPDTWLVGGQRKARFMAKEDDVLTFPLLLLPQRAGYLTLPTVDIRPISEHQRNEQITDGPRSASPAPTLNCETNYQSQGETLLVVPDRNSTTVTLDPDGMAGGAWLVESRHGQDGVPSE